ncbi:MAG: outer membrane beta-barrel protein [Desulfovibrionales bacterium]|nr:outer membrane beta-barrel protein [Desulfovibrionales bacterium]
MKKKAIILSCVMILLFAFSQASLAEETRKFGIGIRASYYNVDTGILVAYDPEIDSSGLYGINLTYFLNEIFSLELSGEYTKADMTIHTLGGKVGEFTQVPILLTARLHLPAGETISPYIGAGLGYYFNDFDKTNSSSTVTGVDNSFGYHVAAGLEVFFLQNWAANLDLKYIWNQADFQRTTGTDEIDLDAFSAGVGLKYYF